MKKEDAMVALVRVRQCADSLCHLAEAPGLMDVDRALVGGMAGYGLLLAARLEALARGEDLDAGEDRAPYCGAAESHGIKVQ